MYKTPLKFKNPDLKKYESKTLKKGKSLCLASLAWKDLDIQASGWGLSCQFKFIFSPFLLPWVAIVWWPAGRHCPRSCEWCKWTWAKDSLKRHERGRPCSFTSHERVGPRSRTWAMAAGSGGKRSLFKIDFKIYSLFRIHAKSPTMLNGLNRDF
jgi:hypothetical protein